MGFDDLVDCSSFVSAAIGQMGCKADVYSHAVGELSKAMRGYSHVEGSSLSRSPVRPSTIIKMSIVREPLLKFNETNSVAFGTKIDWDVLEKNFGPLNSGDVVFYK
jgi:hypothetical protein